MIPGSAVEIDGNNIILENYKIRNPNGQAWEGITIDGAIPHGGNVVLSRTVMSVIPGSRLPVGHTIHWLTIVLYVCSLVLILMRV